MAESSFCSEVVDSDVGTLEEALQAQHQLLQKLYSELDAEREASSSATSEAMSMILRLQGEKAQMKMEASQYQREAEEKLCLADESLAIFEDLIYQKETEIACLEFQVEAYKCKLLGMGCTDLSIPECRFPDLITEIGVHRNVKRQDSLPSLYLKEYFPKRSNIERERSAVTNADQQVGIKSMDSEKKVGTSDLNVHWERIRKLGGRVREMSDGKVLHRANSRNRHLRSYSLSSPDPEHSRLSSNPPSDAMAISVVEKNDASFSSVQDKFEVPQSNDNCKSRGQNEREQKRLVLEGENRQRKPDKEENFELQVSDKTELKNRVTLCPKHKEKSFKRRERTISERQFSLPSTLSVVSDYHLDIQRLKQRIERLESKENTTRQEISAEGEPGLIMLKEILGQINSLQYELKNYKTKSSQLDAPSLDSLSEAMLHFWL